MRKGFTLLEMIITIAIFSVVVVAVLMFQNNTNIIANIVQSDLGSQQQTRIFLRDITALLRTATQANTGSYAIANAGTHAITFYSDTDSAGVREKIRYFLDGTTLKKGVIIPSGTPLAYNPANEKQYTVLHYIANGATPVFTYFDSSYQGTSEPLAQPVDPVKIRLVKISLILDKDPNRAPKSTTVSTQISIRNLKDNL